MEYSQMTKIAKAHAGGIVKTDAWGKDEWEMRHDQVFHAKMSELCRDEAKRLRGEA